MQVADSLRFPRIKSLPDNDDPDFELLGSLQTPYQWGFELCADYPHTFAYVSIRQHTSACRRPISGALSSADDISVGSLSAKPH